MTEEKLQEDLKSFEEEDLGELEDGNFLDADDEFAFEEEKDPNELFTN